MNIDSLLNFLRGSVRPITLLTITGGVVGFLATGKIEEAKFLALFGGPVVGFWFKERSK